MGWGFEARGSGTMAQYTWSWWVLGTCEGLHSPGKYLHA